MKRMLIMLTCLLVLLALSARPVLAGDAGVAERWAPVIYQQDRGHNPLTRGNVCTGLNFDYDWRANNNWMNLPYYPPAAAVYYSLVESDTHYFIGYYLYYPRHTGRTAHEHDLTGVLAVVRKAAGRDGQLDLLVAYSQNRWQKWTGSQVRLANGHPVLTAGADTHELAAAGLKEALPPAGALYPSVSGEQAQMKGAGYRLVDLQELWQRRSDIGQGRTFQLWGYLDSYHDTRTGVPWVWTYRGANWLANPAALVQLLCGGPKKPAAYLNNPYI